MPATTSRGVRPVAHRGLVAERRASRRGRSAIAATPAVTLRGRNRIGPPRRLVVEGDRRDEEAVAAARAARRRGRARRASRRRRGCAAASARVSDCGETPASPKISLEAGDEARASSRSSAPAAASTAAVAARDRGGDDLGRVLPRVGHEGRRGEVVDLVRLRLGDRGADSSPASSRVGGQQRARGPPAAPRPAVGEALAAGARTVPDHLVAAGQQLLREIAAVLAGDAGDENASAHGRRMLSVVRVEHGLQRVLQRQPLAVARTQCRRPLAQLGAGRVDPHDRVGEVPRATRRRRPKPFSPSRSARSRRCPRRRRTTTAPRAPPTRRRRARSPRARKAARRPGALRIACSTRPRSTKPGASTTSPRRSARDRRQHLVALRPVAEDLAAQLQQLSARPRDRRHQRRHALLGDVAAGVDDDRRRVERPRYLAGAVVEAGQDASARAAVLLAQRRACSRERQKARCGTRTQRRADEGADGAVQPRPR